MNILAIGAHPDDIELGCGGTLIKAVREGHNVFMYTLTRGEASGNPSQRTQELQRSAKFIGARGVKIDRFEDTKLTPGPELINAIESYADQVDADVIFTHCKKDIHHDHQAIARATLEGARFSSNIMGYEVPVTKDFQPMIYYDISDVIDEKVELIEVFWSQNAKLYTKARAIKGLAEYRALQSRMNVAVNYVEAFEVVKLCLNEDFRLMRVPRPLGSGTSLPTASSSRWNHFSALGNKLSPEIRRLISSGGGRMRRGANEQTAPGSTRLANPKVSAEPA